MKNGWTGGQYSIYRFVFGICLLIHFTIAGIPIPLMAIGALASIFFAIGWLDRIAAVVLAAVLAWIFGRTPLLFVAWPLIAHVLLPPAPFWSFAARGRVDPRGNWRMPPPFFAAAWIVLSLGYAYSGYTNLTTAPAYAALALLYAPLALVRPVRPWLWLAMLLMHLGLRRFDMVVVHLFTFDPAWVPRRAPATADRVLYDGTCGLCHRSVRFLIAEDVSGTSFVYAPQEGGGASVIVETADGRTLTKSAAVIHLMHRLGGMWRVLGIAFSLVPRPLRDAGYDFVARVRYRIFGRAKEACPMLPPDLRSRFTA